MLTGTIPTEALSASELLSDDQLREQDEMPASEDIVDKDEGLDDDVTVLPALSPDELVNADDASEGASLLVMCTGQEYVAEKGKYAITVYRAGNTAKEAFFTVDTIDYSAKYGKDYRIADDRFETEVYSVEKTLVEQSAEEENIKNAEEAYSELDEAVGAGADGEEGSPETNELTLNLDTEEKEAVSLSDTNDSGMTLAQLKEAQTGLPTRETTEDAVSEPLMGLADVIADEGAFNIGDYLEKSSVTYLSFAPGETKKQLVFEILEDEESEGDELIQFVLGETEDGDKVIEPAMSTIVIEDDEPTEHSLISFSNDTYKAEGSKAQIKLVREGAPYTMVTADVYIESKNGEDDSLFKEVSFNPFRMETYLTLDFNLGANDQEYRLTLNNVKGADEGELTEALLTVKGTGALQGDQFLDSTGAGDTVISNDGEIAEQTGAANATDDDDITIGGHKYVLKEDASLPKGVFKIMTVENDTVLNRKVPVQVGVYYSAESDVFKTNQSKDFGDSPTWVTHEYNSSGKYMHYKWYSMWNWRKGGTGTYFNLPMRRYSSIFADYTALSDWESSRVSFYTSGAKTGQKQFGMSKCLVTNKRQNSDSDDHDSPISERTLFGPLRMTEATYSNKNGKSVGAKDDEGKVADFKDKSMEFKFEVERTAKYLVKPEAHLYGVACMYKTIQFKVGEPDKLEFRTAEGNKTSDYPARAEIRDEGRRYFGETLTLKLEQNDSDIHVPKGRLIGWEITPSRGKKFRIEKKDVVEGKVSYLSKDCLTFTVNDDFIDALCKNGAELKSGDMSNDGFIIDVEVKPLFDYITTIVAVKESEGGHFKDKDLQQPGVKNFNVGDSINLEGVADSGYYFSGYSLATFSNYDDSWAQCDGELFRSPLNVKLTNMERYVLRPVFTKTDNCIEIRMSDNAKKYFTILGLCTDEELTQEYLKGKNILRIDNKQNDSDPAYRPVPGDAYEIRLINTSANDGTYRPVFTIKDTGQKVNGYVADMIAGVSADRNIITVDAEKVAPDSYKYYAVKSRAVYSSAKLRNANGEKTIDPATDIQVMAGGGIPRNCYDKDGNKKLNVLRSKAFTDSDGNFMISGIKAIPGDVIPLTFDNDDRQQVAYITMPDGLPESDTVISELVADDINKTMVLEEKTVKSSTVNIDQVGMPIISPRSPQVAKLYYEYEDHPMRDTTANHVELRPNETINVYVDILDKGTIIRGVKFLVYDGKGIEREVAEGSSQVVAIPLSTGDGNTYKASLKSNTGIKAGDSLFVQIISDSKRSVTLPDGSKEVVNKEYPKLNSGLTFGDVIEAAQAQNFAIEPSAGDYMKKMPFIGDVGDGMLADTGNLVFKKTYLDKTNPDISPYYLTVGAAVSVQDASDRIDKMAAIRNGEHKEAKAAQDEQYTIPEKLQRMTPEQMSNDVEKEALNNSLRNVTDRAQREAIKEEWDRGVKKRFRDQQHKQQLKNSVANIDANKKGGKEQPRWDIKFIVLLQFEYFYDNHDNDYVFSGGQYMFGGTFEYKRVHHKILGYVPVYFAYNLEASMTFDGRFVTDAGKQSYNDMKKEKNLADCVRTEFPWMNIGFKGKFMPGVGIYGIIGARGVIDTCLVFRFAAGVQKGPSGGVMGTIGGGIAADLLIVKLKYDIGKTGFKTGVFDPDSLKKADAGLDKEGIPVESYSLEIFDVEGNEVCYIGSDSESGVEKTGLGIKAPANIADQMILVSNASEYIRPQIVYGENGKRFMTYISRQDGKSRLSYAVDNGTGFSKPQNVDPEGNGSDSTNDILYNAGKVYIVWTDTDKDINELEADEGDEGNVSVEDAKDSLQSSNLKLAVYDFDTQSLSEPVNITNDKYLNSNARLYIEGDTLVIYYYKKDITNAKTVNDLFSEKSNYSTWARADYDITNNILSDKDRFIYVTHPEITDPIVLDYSSAVYKTTDGRSYRMSLYTIDKQMNGVTEDERLEGTQSVDAEIWLDIKDLDNESSTSTPVKIAKGNVTNARLNVMKDDILVTWLADSQSLYTISARSLFELAQTSSGEGQTAVKDTKCIYDHFRDDEIDPITGKKYSIDPMLTSLSSNDEDAVSLSQYQVVSGADGNEYLFTLAPGDESENRGLELWGASYYYGRESTETEDGDNVRTGWGKLVQITHYGKVIDEMDISVDADHKASILANIYENEITEKGLVSKDYKLVELDCVPETSLVFADNLSFKEENRYPNEGETAEIGFTLYNEGLLPANNYTITLSRIQGGVKAQLYDPIVWTDDSDTIFSGEEREFTAVVELPDSIKDLQYVVEVTEMDKNDPSKTYGTNSSVLEVPICPNLENVQDILCRPGYEYGLMFDEIKSKCAEFAKEDGSIDDEAVDQILQSLGDDEIIVFYELLGITQCDINGIATMDDPGINSDDLYAAVYLYNSGNAEALNVKATATLVDDDGDRGAVIGSAKVSKIMPGQTGTLMIPMDTDGGRSFNKVGILNAAVDVTVNGEDIVDPMSIFAYTSENIGLDEKEGRDRFDLKTGDSFKMEMVAYPFDDQKDLYYISGDPDVVSVSDDGTVTAVGSGETSIIVIDYSQEDYPPYKEIKVNVSKNDTVSSLEKNILAYDSVKDGDTLYLLKGCYYTLEAGVAVTASGKKDISISKKKGIKVNKNTTLKLTKGDEKKTINVEVLKKKTSSKTLTSRDTTVTLDELIIIEKPLMPDYENGKYKVEITNDKNGILTMTHEPSPEGIGYRSLREFEFKATGKKGTAKITAIFGGKKATVTVRCGGYPSLEGSENGRIIQTLPDNVLTFDSVNDKDTLILLKNGKYTLEDGVTITPAIKNAIKVNKKTRKLTLGKETVLTLEKGDIKKTILVNYVKVKVKKVTLKGDNKTVTLDQLFAGAYELLPDASDKNVIKDRKNKVLNEEKPPQTESGKTLKDYSLTASGVKGSAKVTLYFGGRAFTATVNYK